MGGVFLGLGPTVKASLAYPRLSLDGGFCPSIQGIHTYTVHMIPTCMHRECILNAS